MSVPASVDSSTIAEMEETIARIRSHKGVEGVMIMNRRGAMNWPTIFSTYLNSDMPEILEYRR